MKLTQIQKVAIYASALQGAISYSATMVEKGMSSKQRKTTTEIAIEEGDKLIAALEARKDDNEADPHEPITD